MNRDTFNKSIAALRVAFPNTEAKYDSESESVYWEMLKDIPDDIWTEGVKQCCRENTFFPTIHDLGAACFGEQKEGWVDKCDPYRERQNYREKVPAISWQQNMAKVFKIRGIEPPETLKLEAPIDDQAARAENRRMRELYDEVKRLKAVNKELLSDRWNLIQECDELKRKLNLSPVLKDKPSIAERRELLKQQAKALLESSENN